MNKQIIDYLRKENVCNEKILSAMQRIDRSRFLPECSKYMSDCISPIPIGYNQTMSAPFIVASMTDLLEPFDGAKVLEVGTGCGYQSAVLLELGVELFSIEYIPELAEFGKQNLINSGYHAQVRCGDGYYGWAEEAPFDRIIATATAPKIPLTLISQLKPNGIMVIPIELEKGTEVMTKIHKTEDSYRVEWLYGVRFVPFVGDINE